MAHEIAVYQELLNEKRFSSQWNAARYMKDLKFAVERRYVEQLLAKRDRNGNNMLLECTPESLVTAFLDAAAAGLSLSPAMGHAYLVPYRPLVTFTPGYRGLIHLGLRGGTVKAVQACLVYAKDPVFKVWMDETGRHFEHQEARMQVKDRGEVTHAYCLAQFVNGGHHLEVMDSSQLAAAEAAGKSKGGAVWGSAFRSEMQKKVPVRRGAKFWPIDPDGHLRHVLETADRHDPIDFDRAETPAGGEIVVNEDQIRGLHATITDQGIETAIADAWLLKTAQASGYAQIEQLPSTSFEAVKLKLQERAKVYVERRKAGEPPT